MTRTYSVQGFGRASRQRQRGISLFTILVLLLLTMLLVLGAMRLSLFNESIVGNQADAQRAYAASEALLRNAEADIRANGLHCAANAGGIELKELHHAPGGQGLDVCGNHGCGTSSNVTLSS